jgi:hypothetical protein
MAKKTSINYLFPPDQVEALPSWKFVLHFEAPSWFRARKTAKAISALRAAQFKAIIFPIGLHVLAYDEKMNTVAVPIEVVPERRAQPGALADYESDFWKLYGNMLEHGFGSVFYEAVDWREAV